MGSGWPGDVIITDDVMSLSRPNMLFFQPNKAQLLGLFRAFLRASIVPMGMDTIPGSRLQFGTGYAFFGGFMTSEYGEF